jgi:hypothetical protein
MIRMDDALASERSTMPENLAFDAEPPVKPNEDSYYPIPTPGKTEVL